MPRSISAATCGFSSVISRRSHCRCSQSAMTPCGARNRGFVESRCHRRELPAFTNDQALHRDSLLAQRQAAVSDQHSLDRLRERKTSRFHPEEREGFQKGIEQAEIEIADFIWMPRRSPVRLFRNGVYPPLRGTTMRLDDAQTILYTRGSVDFFRTYPGLYVPNPLVLHAQRRDTPDWNLLLKETLALTKMNWNGTQFDGALPITLKAARQVGDILKYVPDGTTPDPRYRFYM